MFNGVYKCFSPRKKSAYCKITLFKEKVTALGMNFGNAAFITFTTKGLLYPTTTELRMLENIHLE